MAGVIYEKDMSTRLNNQQRQDAEDCFPADLDDAPVSGVHSSRGYVEPLGFVVDDENPLDDVRIAVDAEKPSQSWIMGLIQTLKKRISSPPPAPAVKEFVPYDEQQLVDLLEMEEADLKVFENILENREMLRLNALAAGMAPEVINTSDDFRFDPELTEIWRERVLEKRHSVVDVRRRLETKRQERKLKNVFVPAFQKLPRF